jgi:CRISPR-associated protein Cmr4
LVCEGTGNLFLEEYRFTQRAESKMALWLTPLAKLMKRDDAEPELKKRLVLVADDMFAHLTRTATPINAHIALNSETKTVTDGALWYEETLPPETVLYVPLLAAKARKEGSTLDATAVLSRVTGLFESNRWLQLGGNETVGMGWCAVSICAKPTQGGGAHHG